MNSESVDVPDSAGGCANIVFDEQNNERSPWKFCNSTKLPRSEVVFFVQAFIIFFLITVCCIKLLLYEIPCEDMPFWTSLLSGVVGYILPSPKL